MYFTEAEIYYELEREYRDEASHYRLMHSN